MKNQHAVCTNVGQCSRANAKTKVVVTDAQSLICEECTRPLYVLETNSEKGFGLKSLLVGSGLVLALLMMLAFFWLRGSGLEPVAARPEPTTPIVDTKPPKTADNDAYSRMIARSEIRLGVLENAVPFYYLENKVQHAGFNYEFMQLIAADREFSGGRTLSVVVAPPAAAYDDVPKLVLSKESGSNEYTADMSMDGLTFPDGEPDPGIVYSNVYFGDQFGYSVITTRKKPISKMDDLRGKRVGVLKTDPDVQRAAERTASGATLVPLDDQVFSKTDPDKRVWLEHYLNSGKVDAIVYDYPYAQAEIKGSDLLISIPRIPGTSLGYKIAMRKHDTELKNQVNSAIVRVKQTDSYRELVRKYFQSDQIQKPEAVSGGRYHTVAPGEYLSTIAQKYYGNSSAWGPIEEANRLASPDLISIGQRLLIP